LILEDIEDISASNYGEEVKS
jgi:hypothetical protein